MDQRIPFYNKPRGKRMKRKRLMIAAVKSGSGKTMITCAFLQALKDRGITVAAYKCGPDYIDPMFHRQVIQVPSNNLDTFFTGEQQTLELFLKGQREDDLAVLEGVMGLYDGLGGIREEGSSYHLAKITHTPIILIVDAKGMGRSVIPLISGFLSYDDRNLIQGVILNRISGGYYEMIKPLLEKELPVRLLGYLPEQEEVHIENRYLGLRMPHETAEIQKKLHMLSLQFAQTVSIEKMIHIAQSACEKELPEYEKKYPVGSQDLSSEPVSIAVARDEAFCFYYQDNLRMLEEYGARLQYVSLLHDRALPEGCCGLLLGGGYPEIYGKELSANAPMRQAIKRAIGQGMPAVAECGGFLYLHSRLIDQEGVSYRMAGVIPAVCMYTRKLVRFGYIELKEQKSRFLPEGECIKGHEFHYYDSTKNGEDCFAIKPVTNRTYSCIIEGENYWFGFPHLYYPSNPVFPERFVEMARRYKERKR